MVYGGPSFFRLEQEVVSDVEIGEQGGAFTTVGGRRRRSTERKKSQTGYNVGVDATYIVWQNDSVRVGAGGFVRFTQADMDVEMLSTVAADQGWRRAVRFRRAPALLDRECLWRRYDPYRRPLPQSRSDLLAAALPARTGACYRLGISMTDPSTGSGQAAGPRS